MLLNRRNARRSGLALAAALVSAVAASPAAAATGTPSPWVADLTAAFGQLITDVQALVSNNFLGIIVLLGLGIGLTVLIKMGGKAKSAA